MTDNKSNDDLIEPKEAAELLNLRFSKRQRDKVAFWRAVHAWGIPHFKFGPRTVKFSRADVLGWLADRRVGKAAA